jgi:hypothetical protein
MQFSNQHPAPIQPVEKHLTAPEKHPESIPVAEFSKLVLLVELQLQNCSVNWL